VDKVMANLLNPAQNASKRGAVLNSGVHDKTGIEWVIKNL